MAINWGLDALRLAQPLGIHPMGRNTTLPAISPVGEEYIEAEKYKLDEYRKRYYGFSKGLVLYLELGSSINERNQILFRRGGKRSRFSLLERREELDKYTSNFKYKT